MAAIDDPRFERMSIALEAANVGVWDWNIVSGEAVFDEQYYRISGYDPDAFAASYEEWRQRIHPDDVDAVLARLEGHLAGRESDYTVEFRFRRADGQWMWLGAKGRIMDRDADGAPLRMVGIHVDITEQRRIQDQLRQSQRMDAIGQLAGGIAHDFNNMLGGILGYADLLAMQMDPDSEEHEFAAGIGRAAVRAGELTGKLLAFSRKGQRSVVVFDVHDEIDAVRSLLAHTLDPRINLVTETGARRSCLRGDPAQIQSAILNLAVNARDAMPEGGCLTIRTSDVAAADGARILVEVSDTGQGIPREMRGRIFEPYFTTKRAGKGTGLGLAAVYGSVLEHGGRIEVGGEEGRGSVFAIELPVVDTTPVDATPSADAPAGERTILVIDDEEMVRRVLRAMLEGAGHRVLEAPDGARGLEIFRQQSADIDLVILDVAMPVMGGEECFAAIRAHDPQARVVIATGFAQATGGHDEAFPGRAGLLHKPFRNDKLHDMVRQAVSTPPPA